jgi:hypothetical protein
MGSGRFPMAWVPTTARAGAPRHDDVGPHLHRALARPETVHSLPGTHMGGMLRWRAALGEHAQDGEEGRRASGRLGSRSERTRLRATRSSTRDDHGGQRLVRASRRERERRGARASAWKKWGASGRLGTATGNGHGFNRAPTTRGAEARGMVTVCPLRGPPSNTWCASKWTSSSPNSAYSITIWILAPEQNIFYTDPATTLIKGVLSLGLWIHG